MDWKEIGKEWPCMAIDRPQNEGGLHEILAALLAWDVPYNTKNKTPASTPKLTFTGRTES